MAELYYTAIKEGRMTIDDIPNFWKVKVSELIAERAELLQNDVVQDEN